MPQKNIFEIYLIKLFGVKRHFLPIFRSICVRKYLFLALFLHISGRLGAYLPLFTPASCPGPPPQ
jgi:hypothetical protein